MKAETEQYQTTDPVGADAGDLVADFDRSIHSTFEVDEHNHCLGGYTRGPGFGISWKHGPEDRYAAEPEDALEAVLQRLRFFQRGPAMCLENETAIDHVRTAIRALEMRTERRQATGVEGTFAP